MSRPEPPTPGPCPAWREDGRHRYTNTRVPWVTVAPLSCACGAVDPAPDLLAQVAALEAQVQADRRTMASLSDEEALRREERDEAREAVRVLAAALRVAHRRVGEADPLRSLAACADIEAALAHPAVVAAVDAARAASPPGGA